MSERESRVRFACAVLCAAGLLACGANKAVTDEEAAKAAAEKKHAMAAAEAQAAQPKTTIVEVREDCSSDRADVHLSRKGADRVHWTLQGGTGKLGIELKDARDEEKGRRFAGDLKVDCPGTAECWAKVKPEAGVGDRHEYRYVVNGKACPDPFIIIDP